MARRPLNITPTPARCGAIRAAAEAAGVAVSGLRQDCGLGEVSPEPELTSASTRPAGQPPVTPPAPLCLAILPGQVAARSEEEPEGRGKGCVAIPTGRGTD